MDEEAEKTRLIESLVYPFLFVALLWFIKFSEIYFFGNFLRLGILPRQLKGLTGIFTAPLIHGDITHLISNTLPLIILGIIIFYFYTSSAPELFLWIYLATGLMVWIAADGSGYHLGASGLIYGFVSFLFFSGIFRRDRRSMALALLVTFVYGGIVWGVLPIYQGVSWESHLFGGLIGGVCAWFYRKRDRIPEEEEYEWMKEEKQDVETEEEDSEFSDSGHYLYNPETGRFTFRHSNPNPQSPGILFRYNYKHNNEPDSGSRQKEGEDDSTRN